MQNQTEFLFGVSGGRILNVLVERETDPNTLADLGNGRLKRGHEMLLDAPAWRSEPMRQQILKLSTERLNPLDRRINALDRMVTASGSS